MALLIVGITVVDVIFPRVPRLPAWPAHLEFTGKNLVLLAEPPVVTIGGNGANAAWVAARCGARVVLHSNVASDPLGKLARGWLKAAGCRLISASGAKRTAVNVTAADPRLRRATFFYPGTPPGMPASARGSSFALVCGWPHPPAVALGRKLRAWKAQGTRTAYDVGPLLGKAPSLQSLKAVLDEVDVFIGNEHEAMTIARARTLAVALKRLHRACAGHLVIKLGGRGAIWQSPEMAAPRHFPAPRVKATNTVGAGDTFNGAFLAALDRGNRFPAALRCANRAAAAVVASGRGVLGLGEAGR